MMSDFPAEMMDTFAIVMVVILAIYAIMMAFAILSYVLRSIGLYSIAKRRGIHNPWLAWIPIGDQWIIGSISDQYQYVAKGKIRNRRKVLLGLSIGTYAAAIIMIVAEIVMTIALLDTSLAAIAPALVVGVLGLALLGASITMLVFFYIALHDMYQSCHPENAVMFLVLGIFMSFLQPFFIFACRKKDLGMPPRKQPQPVQEIPQPAVEPEVVEPQPEVVEAETAEDAEDVVEAEPAEETAEVVEAEPTEEVTEVVVAEDFTADDEDFEEE